MKSRTIEIIDNHIKALEEELEWYQEKNREWQEKCEKSDEEFHRCHKAYMIDTEYLTNKLAKCRDENARLRDQLRWHPVSELPRTEVEKLWTVNVLMELEDEAEVIIAYYSIKSNCWYDYRNSDVLEVNDKSRWCYIPEGGDA